MALHRTILAAVCVVLTWASTVQAQPPADQPPADQPPADQPPADQPPADQPPADQPPQAAIVAPQPADVPDVPYPEGATGNAEVILVLVVGADGSVRSAEIGTGQEPFASAAREASTNWRFTPATRNSEPVTAKIRFRVSFLEETVPGPGPDPYPALDPSPTPSEPAAAPEQPPRPPIHPGVIDVTVKGEPLKHPPSVSSFTRAEVRQLPGAFGDPFRAIEVLPGVTPIVSGLPFFYVRGAPPGNIGYYLDGVRVPYLFHVAAGPSVVHPAIVERVDLYAGGYPARFGRYSGAIVSAETTEPRADWHGEGVFRLVDVGALVEGGFADGRGTALLGGRYSYTALVLSQLAPEVTVDYRDFQGRASFDITDRDRVSLFAFGAYDYLSQTSEVDSAGEEVETVLFGSEFYRIDGRYDARLTGGGKLRAAVTWGFDQTRIFGTRNSRNTLLGTRTHVSQPLSSEVTVRAGLDLQIDEYTADARPYSDPDDPFTQQFNNLFPPRADTAVAGWTDVVWKPSKRLEVTPGLRVDTYLSEGEKALAVDPRLAVVAHVTDDLRTLHAFGVANQPPSFVVPVPGLAVASLRGGLQRSLQASAGVEVDLPLKITASVTGFTGVYLNMTDAIGAQQNPIEDELIPRSLGSSKGLEIYIRRSLSERLGGFLSYTLSRTTRSVGREHFLASFDRPHVLHAALGYRLGGGWQTGFRFSIYSGAVLGPAEDEDIEEDSFEPEESSQPAESSETVRDPLFYRLDFRVEKKWRLFDTAWISLVAEMINATLNKETLGGTRAGPVTIPSIGIEGGF
ncbi:MAG: TonB-dependent receptor plug domain-containing protein [Deltaproteobacteria bacterium]|nr:TonB-dependent receptor plug domain-containing protein [Deltaproteobacteria bacterium]